MYFIYLFIYLIYFLSVHRAQQPRRGRLLNIFIHQEIR